LDRTILYTSAAPKGIAASARGSAPPKASEGNGRSLTGTTAALRDHPQGGRFMLTYTVTMIVAFA
jgi:hypothetical protein